jgi:cell division protein ZapA
MSQSIKVQIFGQTFSIQGELDESYVQKLAAYVNQKMNAISEMAPTVDGQRLAVMAALAIADELHSLKERNGEQEEILKEQAERCLNLVERALTKKE